MSVLTSSLPVVTSGGDFRREKFSKKKNYSGKHFRHIRVVFQEKDADGNCRWEAEADVNKVYLASVCFLTL